LFEGGGREWDFGPDVAVIVVMEGDFTFRTREGREFLVEISGDNITEFVLVELDEVGHFCGRLIYHMYPGSDKMIKRSDEKERVFR
jgi:hypothetical protein